MQHNWTSPESDVFESIDTILAENRDGVLVTIVDVEGNAYRRPGAKMVVDGGEGIGQITAGCLEDEVLELSRDVLEDGRPQIETFDLMEDDDVWGLGMGCHGIIDVLLEPIGPELRAAVDAFQGESPVGFVTVLESSVDGVARFGRGIYHPDRGLADLDGSDDSSDVTDRIERAGATLVSEGKSKTVTIETSEGMVTAFIDSIQPPPELVVVGTGPDAEPVADLARRNGFRVTVVGYRGGQADSDRFPNVAVCSTSPRSLRSIRDFESNTFVVVMTHNYVDDLVTLQELLDTDVPYIALVGAQDRIERMVSEIRETDGQLDPEDRERIYAPAGLDLGGGSPNQIATSIVAELLAVHNDRTPGHLRARKGPIHDRIELPDSPIKS